MTEIERSASKPVLALIESGIECLTAARPVRVFPAAASASPFPVQARVLEEDTFFVLSAPAVIREPREHPVRLMTELYEIRAATPGTVRVKGRRPYRFLAVVHDLDEEPTWREEWVARALDTVFTETERLGIHALALPVLAGKHGNLRVARFWGLMRASLERAKANNLERIWLILPSAIDESA